MDKHVCMYWYVVVFGGLCWWCNDTDQYALPTCLVCPCPHNSGISNPKQLAKASEFSQVGILYQLTHSICVGTGDVINTPARGVKVIAQDQFSGWHCKQSTSVGRSSFCELSLFVALYTRQ